MSVEFGTNEGVKIDVCHAALVMALVSCRKPKTILELGVGGGRSTEAILSGLAYNTQPYEYTLVDNWLDFGGTMPPEVEKKYGKALKIVTADEKDFVFSNPGQYDFIMSDADHNHTNEWFDHVYENLLNTNGILIYHDINLVEDAWPNLRQILLTCIEKKYTHYLFNKSSRPEERCHRGLLVIFKNVK
jgi:predicted O-methyltransferase YrrM